MVAKKGTVLTPEQRAQRRPKNMTQAQLIERARNAGKVAQSPETYAKNLVRFWPALSAETQATIRTVLSPIVGNSR
jgi:hypothetical protein